MAVEKATNVDHKVAEGFGDEWTRFDQTELSDAEKLAIYREYFAIFPPDRMSPTAVGADFGVGSGRWASVVAPRVGKLFCVDASAAALSVARRNLSGFTNCEFLCSSVNDAPLEDESLDFAYSLGVLHHIPDTAAAMRACVAKLKPGAPFLVYLYYRFDNKPVWYALLWRLSEFGRRTISRLPYGLRYALSQCLAFAIYLPLARVSAVLERFGMNVENVPLAYYRNKAFYVMRTDALDRFGTRLEQRFTQPEIRQMMQACGLRDILFCSNAPFWCAIGFKEESRV